MMDGGHTDHCQSERNAHDEWYAAHRLRQKNKPNPMQVCADCECDFPEGFDDCPFCEVSRVTGEPVPHTAPSRHKEIRLFLDNNDRPIWNMANAITLLTDHADWRGVLAFNSFTMQRVLLRAIPGQKAGEFPRPLEDDDYSAARAWFN